MEFEEKPSFCKDLDLFPIRNKPFLCKEKVFCYFQVGDKHRNFFFRLKDCAIHNQRPFLAIKHNSRMTNHLLQPPPPPLSLPTPLKNQPLTPTQSSLVLSVINLSNLERRVTYNWASLIKTKHDTEAL